MLYRNICLIGLPYSGKTQIGRLLYKHLNKGFIDTDDIIISKYKTNLSNIISDLQLLLLINSSIAFFTPGA